MEDTDKIFQIQSELDSSIDGGVCNNHLHDLSKTPSMTSTDFVSLYGQASEVCSINDKHTMYTDSVNHPVPTRHIDLNQDAVKDVLKENINIAVSNYHGYESMCEKNLDSSQVINEFDPRNQYDEYENILDYNLNENERSCSQGYGHEQLPIQTDRTLEGIQLQESHRIHGQDGQGKLYETFPYCHKKGPDHVEGLLGQKDESGVPGNIGSAGAAGDQDQPVLLSGDGATELENISGKVKPKPNSIIEGQSGETGRCGIPGNLESTRDAGEAVLSGLHKLMGQIARLSREIATCLKSFTGKVIKPIQNIKVEGHSGETKRFGLPGMFRSPDDASEIGDIGLSEIPGQEGEVEDSDQVEHGFTGPKQLAVAVLKEQKGIQGEPTKPVNTLPIDKRKESREQRKSGVIVLTGIHDFKGLLLLVILSSGFITSSAKCILTKHVTGSDQNISMQVCHSTECDGTERWDRSKGSNLEHIYIEDALGESKMSDRYILERNDNCSVLSIENVTEEDILDATYQFVIGTSDKIPIQLKHEPIIYKTNDSDPVQCNGDLARLTVNMTVLHIKNHPSFKYYTEREDFSENLMVCQSLEKIGLWFVTTIFSVIDIRENNFNETFNLVYKDTKDVIIFDEAVICNGSEATVESISKENKTSVVEAIVIVFAVLAVLAALYVLFRWYFRTKRNQRVPKNHSRNNSDLCEDENLMNGTAMNGTAMTALNVSGKAENDNNSEPNDKIED